MQLSTDQYRVLGQMGIPIWLERTSGVEAVQQVSSEAAIELDLSASVWLGMPTMELSQAEANLLHAMLKAVNLDRSMVSLFPLEALAQVLEQSAEQHQLLLFDIDAGQHVKPDYQAESAEVYSLASSAQLSVTYSLSDLLAQPQRKRHAWQVLQRLFLT